MIQLIQVIIPVWNEAENIRALLEDFLELRKSRDLNLKLIVVNDGSDDDSKLVVENFREKHSFVDLINHDRNYGYSKTLQSGINYAASEGVIVIFDGDKQFRVSELPKFLDLSNEYDIVAGHRRQRADPLVRRALGRLWSVLGSFVTQVKVKDLNCGFKLFKASLLKSINFKTQGPGFNLEVFSKIAVSPDRYVEIPVEHYARKHGKQSGASWKTLRASFLDILRAFN